MAKKQKLIVANWKANPLTVNEAKKIAKGIIKHAKKTNKVDVVVCPSFPHLEVVSKSQRGDIIDIGAQSISSLGIGSNTGEVPAEMLKDFKTKYVILGHSERRSMGETEQDISTKIKLVLKQKMTPILCIGELERDTNGNYLAFLHDQLVHSLGDISKKEMGQIVIAYEPVWSIGGNTAMAGGDVHQIVIFIQKIINDAFGKDTVKKVRILYGGSVNEDNAEDIIANGYTDGLLIGRQSLYPDVFGKIINIASKL